MKWLIAVMLLINVFALNYSYDGLVYTEPGKTIAVPIYISSTNEEGLYRVKCISATHITCPSSFFVEPGKEKSFEVSITPGLGSYPVNIRIGNDLLEFEVISSDQIDVFFARLENYDDLFFRLEKNYGESPIINDAKLLIEEGYQAHGVGDFDALNGITDNLGSILSDYYDTLDPSNLFEAETPSKLKFSVIPLLLLVGLIIVLYKRPKKELKRTYVDELSTLVRKEEYEIGSR